MSEILLDVRDLSVRYRVSRTLADLVRRRPGREVKAVDCARLVIRRGETVGLVGESGSGKSSLGRALLGLAPASDGQVMFDGEDVLTLPRRALFGFRKRAQMVFQDPSASLSPHFTVGETLAEVLRVHAACTAEDIPDRVTALLETVGLSPDLARRRPRNLSGGQCQRVGIARALALQPEFIIADEPVSALDLSIQAQILNLFLALQRRMRLTMLFISHDLGVVHHLCRRVAVMYLGRIVEDGPAEEVFQSPRHPYTRTLLEAIPRVDLGSKQRDLPRLDGEPPSPSAVPPGCAFHTRCAQAMEPCRHGPPPAPRKVGAVSVACHLYQAMNG